MPLTVCGLIKAESLKGENDQQRHQAELRDTLDSEEGELVLQKAQQGKE